MPLYYITGIAGAGKSTLRLELQSRGYLVYGIDEDRLAARFNKITGQIDTKTHGAAHRTKQWRAQHEYRFLPGVIERLRAKAITTVFLCGVTADDRTYWGDFATVFFLNASPEVLKTRILSRTGNDYGKNEHEMQAILDWAATAEAEYRDLGAKIIDATQSTDKIADDIESYVRK